MWPLISLSLKVNRYKGLRKDPKQESGLWRNKGVVCVQRAKLLFQGNKGEALSLSNIDSSFGLQVEFIYYSLQSCTLWTRQTIQIKLSPGLPEICIHLTVIQPPPIAPSPLLQTHSFTPTPSIPIPFKNRPTATVKTNKFECESFNDMDKKAKHTTWITRKTKI